MKLVVFSTLLIAGFTLIYSGKTLAYNPMGQTTIAQRIAQRFNLKQEDVQAVFDQVRQERQQLMQQKYQSWLDQLVKEGKITEQQKQLLLNKHQEIQANRLKTREDLQNKTFHERKNLREQERQELENWAKQNGIDPQYLFGFGQKNFGMGRGHRPW